MTYEEFKRQAEKILCCEVLEEQDQEYSVLGYENGEVDLIPSHAGFITHGVQFYWDGYRKNNLFDKDVEIM